MSFSLTVTDFAQFAMRFKLGSLADQTVNECCKALEQMGRTEDANVLRAIVVRIDRSLLERPMTEAVGKILGRLGSQEIASVERIMSAAKTVGTVIASRTQKPQTR